MVTVASNQVVNLSTRASEGLKTSNYLRNVVRQAALLTYF